MATLRQVVTDTYQSAERVLVRGRTTTDHSAQEDGQFDEVVAETCHPIGVIARPASNATVAAVVLNAGADSTNPYMIGAQDSTRKLVIDARGIASDVTILYNTTDVVEIRDGKIRAGSLGGATDRLPTWADFNALRDFVRDQFDSVSGHVHVTPAGPTTTITTSGTPATAVAPADAPAPAGTQRFEAE